MPIPKTVNQDFFKTWSPEMAYVLGFFAADGSMCRTRRDTHFIDFYVTDRPLLVNIRRALGANHKISKRVRRYPWKAAYHLQIGSKEIFRDLERLGMTQGKSLSIRMPKVPRKYFSNFLLGYFDGDGCVHLGRYWHKDRRRWRWQLMVVFTSGSKNFLKDLWAALRPWVTGGRLGSKTRGYELVFSQHDSFALFKLMYHNAPARLLLERKRKIFLKALKILNAGVV